MYGDKQDLSVKNVFVMIKTELRKSTTVKKFGQQPSQEDIVLLAEIKVNLAGTRN